MVKGRRVIFQIFGGKLGITIILERYNDAHL